MAFAPPCWNNHLDSKVKGDGQLYFSLNATNTSCNSSMVLGSSIFNSSSQSLRITKPNSTIGSTFTKGANASLPSVVNTCAATSGFSSKYFNILGIYSAYCIKSTIYPSSIAAAAPPWYAFHGAIIISGNSPLASISKNCSDMVVEPAAPPTSSRVTPVSSLITLCI